MLLDENSDRKQKLIDRTLALLDLDQYSAVKRHHKAFVGVLKRILETKVLFIKAVPSSKEFSFSPSACSGFSFDTLLIAEESSDEDIIFQMVKYSLGIAALKVQRHNHDYVIFSGFERSEFIYKDDRYICNCVDGRQLNNAAKSMYAKFFIARNENNISLDEFFAKYKLYQHLRDSECSFIELGNLIGNDMLYQSFINSDNSVIENIIKPKGLTRLQFYNSFEDFSHIELMRSLTKCSSG